MGPKLTKLNLVHIEELDARAILLLSQSCSNLNILGFYNCGFREPTVRDDDAFLMLDRQNRMDEEAMMMSTSWLDLEKLNITSEVKNVYLKIDWKLRRTQLKLTCFTDRRKATDYDNFYVFELEVPQSRNEHFHKVKDKVQSSKV